MTKEIKIYVSDNNQQFIHGHLDISEATKFINIGEKKKIVLKEVNHKWGRLTPICKKDSEPELKLTIYDEKKGGTFKLSEVIFY